MESFSHIFHELLIFMGAGLAAFWLCRTLNLSLTLGYLLVGLAIGPSFLALLSKPSLHLLGDLGVFILLFAVGLELPLHRLQSLRSYIFGLGLLQIFFSSALIFAFFWLVFGKVTLAQSLLCIALSFSSTAIVIQLLKESDELSARGGRAAFSILLIQDISFVALIVAADFFQTTKGPEYQNLLWVIGTLFLGTLALYYGGRWAATLLGRQVERNQNSDMPIFIAFGFLLSMAYLGTELKLSAEFGAFVAGLSWADTRFRRHMEHYIRPFRVLTLAVFFMMIGIKLNFSSLIDILPQVVPCLLLILLLKACVATVLGRIFRLSVLSAIKLGVLIAGCGELAIILLSHPLLSSLGQQKDFVMALAILSMVMTPFLWSGLRFLITRWEAKNSIAKRLLSDKPDIQNHVIVAGFGKTGAIVVRLLEKNMIPYVAFDYDVQRVQEGKKNNHTVIHGDSRDGEFLKKIGVQNAKIFLITFNSVSCSVETVQELRYQYPDLEICAKIRGLDHAHKLERFGVHVVLPETLESSVKLASLAFHTLGFRPEDVHMMLKLSPS